MLFILPYNDITWGCHLELVTDYPLFMLGSIYMYIKEACYLERKHNFAICLETNIHECAYMYVESENQKEELALIF